MRDDSDDTNICIPYSYFVTEYGAASILGAIVNALI